MDKTAIEYLQERLAAKLGSRKASTFAADVGLKADVIRDILRKGTMPSAERLATIADGLEVSMDYLLGRTDNASSIEQNQPIEGDTAILAMLARIVPKLSDTDINVAFGVIKLAIAKQGGSKPAGQNDQSEPATPRHEAAPSR